MNGSTGTELPRANDNQARPIWGFNQVRALCRELGVAFCAPEWGPMRQFKPTDTQPTEADRYADGKGSPYPGDDMRLVNYAKVVAGSAQDPKAVYKALWHK